MKEQEKQEQQPVQLVPIEMIILSRLEEIIAKVDALTKLATEEDKDVII